MPQERFTLFPPKYIENKLKFYPRTSWKWWPSEHERDHCAAFVNIDLEAVGNWAERNNLVSYASYQELAAHPDVYAMIQEHVDEVNRDLANEPNVAGAQIKRFLILHKELDADDGELTRTAKVRRSFITKRYAADRGRPVRSRARAVQFIEHRGDLRGRPQGRARSRPIEIRDMKTYPVKEAVLKEAG